mgnify:CR=1 FL=1
MAKIDLGKSLKKAGSSLQDAMDSVKTAAKDVKLPDIKAPDMKAAQEKVQKQVKEVKDVFKKKRNAFSGIIGDARDSKHFYAQCHKDNLLPDGSRRADLS